MSPRSKQPSHGQVRIIGGRWRGTRLPVADAEGMRPTPDRVRETLFNWLQPKLPGARVLDLFAGSGALGLEALSRGAREAWLVERDPGQCESLRGTIAKLGAEGDAHVVRADATSWLQAPMHGGFDIVFVDPPFAAALWEGVIERLPPWLAADAWLYLESPAGRDVVAGAAWLPHRGGQTRETRYALYRRRPAPADTLDPEPDADGGTTE